MSLRQLIRPAIALLAVAGSLWLTIAVTINQVFGDRNPRLATALWPGGSKANVGLAQLRLEQDRASPESLAAAKQMAERALSRDPLNVAAARTWGLVVAAQGMEQPAERMMRFAEKLSKRDVRTQMWMIEARVRQNDIAGALHHYDLALRSSLSARQPFFPILTSAATDPNIAARLGEVLAKRPPWGPEFTTQFVANSADARAITTLLSRVRLDPANEGERQLLRSAIERLVGMGEFRSAESLYSMASGRPNLLIRNSGFDLPNEFPPLDWQLTQEPGLTAEQRSVEGSTTGDHALFLTAENERGGPVARQLLLLPAGRYRLVLAFGDTAEEEAANPRITMRCVDSDIDFATVRLPAASSAGRRSESVVQVPQGNCPAQWLTISAASRLDAASSAPWISSLHLALQ